MANLKSSEKRNRQSQKRRTRNIAVRTEVKGALKSLREAVGSKDVARASEVLKASTRALSKAASKGVLHKRNASRRISRMAKAVARVAAPAK